MLLKTGKLTFGLIILERKQQAMQALYLKARRGRPSWQIIWLLAGLIFLAGCGDNPTAAPAANTLAPTAVTTAGTLEPVKTAQAGTTTAAAITTAAPTGTTATTAAAPTTAAAAVSNPGQGSLTTAPATITRANGEKLEMTIELARTEKEQATGLMGRQSVPDETGMLFIFKQPGQVGFWMKDTPLALSIAFIDQDGKILDIQDMEPFSLAVHSPGRNYLYALEVSKGYFARKGVQPGDTFTFKS
jgi:uncharacterized membrane protein (UPF0127 family)